MPVVVEQEFDPAIPISAISEHPANPREGDDASVGESIDKTGFYGAIIVQRSTGFICAGNTRYRQMRERQDTIPGFWVDCDDETAERILAADNRTSDLASYNQTLQVALLTSIRNHQGDLVGTGYSNVAFELLLQAQRAETLVGGVRQGLPPSERVQDYLDSGMRNLVLPYGPDDFTAVTEGLARLRAEMAVDTNSEVIFSLVTRG